MPRAIWKGAISFGLVHVPVSLYPASQETEVDFDWLDKRSMDPVGYKRVNKRTGKEVDKDDIVKGVRQENGDYVVLSDEEVREAFPRSTRTIEIESFVKAEDVSFVYIEKPYYLEPDAKAGRVYALLRDALAAAGVMGIARVVMHTKEHLAALLPAGPALMLGTLRWADEIRSHEGLDLPDGSAARPKPAELKMAQQLIHEMTTEWKPHDYADRFSTAIRDLVARKAKAGKTETVEPLEEAPDGDGSNVVDLTELLRNSLRRGNGTAAAKAPARSQAAARKAAPAARGNRTRAGHGRSTARRQA